MVGILLFYGDISNAKFSTTFPFDDHTARLYRALICTGFDVTSFSFKREVTKKVNQAVPSWISPGIAALQSKTRDKHISRLYRASR